MSTALQGLVMNPNGFIPVAGVTVVAQSTTGYSEGSSTTDSNGWFSLTGLSNKNWVAKITSAPPDVGNILLLPNDVDHADLSSVSADQHHAGFIGLLDNAGESVLVGSDDRIQITDDGIINADLLDVGILALTIDQGQIDHGSIGGTTHDDHSRYADLGGRSGGQEFFGGEDSGDNLTLRSTTHGTKGSVYIGSSTLFEFDETTGQLILPTTGSSAGILIGGDALWYRSAANVMRTPDALTVDGVLTASAGASLGADIDMNGNNIDDGGVIFLIEQAEADADVAGSGQIWVDTATPNRLFFTDDTGEDFPLTPVEKGIEFWIDGRGAEIPDGIAGWLEVPFNCTIKAVHLAADQTGSIKVDLWVDSYANYPPTNDDTITGANEPEIAAGIKDEDATLTDWTVALSKGDYIYYNVDSCTTIQKCLVTLQVDKT